MALRSHILAGARFGPIGTHETILADEMWPSIPDHSLAIVDRGFFSARILIGLERGGIERHWLTRARTANSAFSGARSFKRSAASAR